MGYSDQISSVSLTISESTLTGNAHCLGRAFCKRNYAYQVSVPPVHQGQDIKYTLFNGIESAVVSDAAAVAPQKGWNKLAKTY